MLHSIRRRAALAATVASGAALVVASPALAVAKNNAPKIPKVAAYKVEFEGEGRYGVLGTNVNGATTTVVSTYKWDVKYRTLIFLRSAGANISSVANPKRSTASGDWSITASSPDPSSNCATKGTLALGPDGGIEGLVQPSGKAVFKVSVGIPGLRTATGADNGATACSTTDFWHEWPISFSHIGNGDIGEDNDPLTGFTTLTKEDFSHGKIVENLSNVSLKAPNLTINPSCGGDAGTTCDQDFSWTGHLTLTKTHV